MNKRVGIKQIVRGFLKFFPFHLVSAHLKHNLLGVIYWVLLFSIITGNFGSSFGIPSLFFSPEYLGETSVISFFFLGFSIGGFVMAFQTYSYIRLGPKFPFIATLSRPFFKFCVNNSILPLVFSGVLFYQIYLFQAAEELATHKQILFYILSLITGQLSFIGLSFLYFFPTNKDIYKITGRKKGEEPKRKPKKANIKSTLHKNQSWEKSFNKGSANHYIYLGRLFKFKESRDFSHYDVRVIQNVFNQNHINASIFEITVIISFFAIGLLRNNEVFQFPAAVSIMLLFTIVLMLISAFYSWFKLWTYPILIGLFVVMNYASKHTQLFQFKNYAYGLSYVEGENVSYSNLIVDSISHDINQNKKDKLKYIQTLENWKSKNQSKPKLVIVNSSGGGLRSAVWTFTVLQKLDSLSNCKFSNNIQMITGASGGMIGAAYYRELMLQNKRNPKLSLLKSYRTNMSKDLLNRLAFTISTNDILLRYQTVEINKHVYTSDRGYAFEQQLLMNTEGLMNKSLGDYEAPETKADIPTMIFSPTIVNDGRRLLIASQNLGFLFTDDNKNSETFSYDNVEYRKLFKSKSADQTRFTSVLRMNATFPYIMPMVTMPTNPAIHIMDAGIRDNYGTKTTVRYLNALEDWIRENTSGVIVLKIRDTKRNLDETQGKTIALSDKLTLPFGNVYGNFPRVQDYDQDELLYLFTKRTSFPVDIISFNLREKSEDKIALSWHLTRQEKKKIETAFESNANKAELVKLFNLLELENGR